MSRGDKSKNHHAKIARNIIQSSSHSKIIQIQIQIHPKHWISIISYFETRKADFRTMSWGDKTHANLMEHAYQKANGLIHIYFLTPNNVSLKWNTLYLYRMNSFSWPNRMYIFSVSPRDIEFLLKSHKILVKWAIRLTNILFQGKKQAKVTYWRYWFSDVPRRRILPILQECPWCH